MFTEDKYPTNFPASTFVPPEGPLNAAIMVIGEAPGAKEDEEGRPFVGGAGNMLDHLLRKVDIERKDIFITNVIKRRPPKNNIDHPLARAEIQSNLQALYREIRMVKPRVVVPLGNTALRALGVNHNIGNCRGYVIPHRDYKIIPTWHPAYLLRQFHEKYTSQKDWEKIKRYSRGATIPHTHEMFEISPTIEDIERFEVLVSNKVNSGQKVSIGLDLETEYIEDSPLDTPIKLVGMALSDSHAIVVPFIKQDGSRYWESKDEELRAIVAVGNILENPNVEIVTHNSMFDITVLMNHGFPVNARMYDTMIAQYLCYHPSQQSLEYLASIHADVPMWKVSVGKSDEEYRRYNAKDSTILLRIKRVLDKDIEDSRLRYLCDIAMNVIKPTCRMMLNGVSIDSARHASIKLELEQRLENLKGQLGILAGERFNPDSPSQVGHILFDKFKFKSGVKTKKGKKSTGSDVLNRLANRYPDNEFIEALLEYRHYSQQYKTFVKDIYIQEDGRVHSEFKLTRVPTGRYSSSNPNLQNLPARQDEDGFIRGMYSVPTSRILVSADYSQVELMIFAVLADDPIWIKAFEEGLDVHSITAEGLLGFYDPKYRTFVKNFTYGLIYGSEGGEIEKVAPRELIQKISVQDMLRNLQREHPQLFEYRKRIEEFLKKNLYVVNAFGRRRYIPKMSLSAADYRAAYNHPVQGTAADIMHIKTPLIEAALHDDDMLVLQLHDAYYIETYERDVDRVARTLKTVMEEPVESPSGHKFLLKADIEVGTSLAKKDMKPWN